MQIGPYQVLQEVARGGTSVVYRARAADGREVALKQILAERTLDPRPRKRYQLEVQALARLSHPNVVQILDAGEHQGAPWIALELVQGQSLEARLRQGPLAIQESIRLAQQLAQALAYVHACNLLHRDLKPDNVLLRGDQALLTDFGLVLDEQTSHSRLTATGAMQGTPGYWAPEQASGAKSEIGPATDVYGLGGVLYACLTGQPPVQGTTLQEVLLATQAGAQAPPSRLRAEVPRWLDTLCMRCLAVAPSDRPRSADEVARALALGANSARPGTARRAPLVALAALAALSLGGLSWVAVRGGATSEAEAHLESGRAKLKTREVKRAVEDLDRALEADPNNAQAYLSRGQGRARLERYQEALHDYDYAIELNPTLAEAHSYRAKVLVCLDRERDAIAAYDRAIELSAEPADYVQRGLAREQLGALQEAEADFSLAIEADPSYALAYASRASCVEKLGRAEQAIADYGRAIELKPGPELLAKVYGNRGVSKAKLGRREEAIADYDRALELGPQLTLYLSRGVSKVKLGRYEEAIGDFDRALDIDPTVAAVWVNRAKSKAGLGRHAEAIADYDRALELGVDSKPTVVLLNRGMSKALLKRRAEALVDFDRALELDPNMAPGYGIRGKTLMLLERYAEALADFERALELGMNEADAKRARNLIAQAKAKLGQPE